MPDYTVCEVTENDEGVVSPVGANPCTSAEVCMRYNAFKPGDRVQAWWQQPWGNESWTTSSGWYGAVVLETSIQDQNKCGFGNTEVNSPENNRLRAEVEECTDDAGYGYRSQPREGCSVGYQVPTSCPAAQTPGGTLDLAKYSRDKRIPMADRRYNRDDNNSGVESTPDCTLSAVNANNDSIGAACWTRPGVRYKIIWDDLWGLSDGLWYPGQQGQYGAVARPSHTIKEYWWSSTYTVPSPDAATGGHHQMNGGWFQDFKNAGEVRAHPSSSRARNDLTLNSTVVYWKTDYQARQVIAHGGTAEDSGNLGNFRPSPEGDVLHRPTLVGDKGICKTPRCPAGKKWNNEPWDDGVGPVCVACEPGKYSVAGTAGCTAHSTACPIGQGFTAGSLIANATCTPCVAGTYSDEINNQPCTNQTTLTCSAGEELVSGGITTANTCRGCDPYKYSVAGEACIDQPNLNCPLAGGVTVLGDPTTANTCEPCAPGKYSFNESCLDCARGNVSGGGVTSCTPCLGALYQPDSGGRFCNVCPQGKKGGDSVRDDQGEVTTGNINCNSCEAGSVFVVANGVCTTCPLGTMNVQGEINQPDKCEWCAPGTFQDDTGMSVCRACCAAPGPCGEYSGWGENDSCTPCPKINNSLSSADITCSYEYDSQFTGAYPCKPGYEVTNRWSDSESHPGHACTDLWCKVNERVTADKRCEPCPPGKENSDTKKALDGKTECTEVICSENHYVQGNECLPCELGMYRRGGDNAYSGGNTSCSRGCIAEWGDCDKNCTRTYNVLSEAIGDGAQCIYPKDGDTRLCTEDQNQCDASLTCGMWLENIRNTDESDETIYQVSGETSKRCKKNPYHSYIIDENRLIRDHVDLDDIIDEISVADICCADISKCKYHTCPIHLQKKQDHGIDSVNVHNDSGRNVADQKCCTPKTCSDWGGEDGNTCPEPSILLSDNTGYTRSECCFGLCKDWNKYAMTEKINTRFNNQLDPDTISALLDDNIDILMQGGDDGIIDKIKEMDSSLEDMGVPHLSNCGVDQVLNPLKNGNGMTECCVDKGGKCTDKKWDCPPSTETNSQMYAAKCTGDMNDRCPQTPENESKCCTEYDKCGVLTCPRGYMNDPQKNDKHCKNPICNITDDIDCCHKKGTCSTLACGRGYHNLKQDTYCKYPLCSIINDRDTCCAINETCEMMTCPDGYYKKQENADRKCWGSLCDQENKYDKLICCIEGEYTAPVVDCSEGYSYNSEFNECLNDKTCSEAFDEGLFTCPFGTVLEERRDDAGLLGGGVRRGDNAIDCCISKKWYHYWIEIVIIVFSMISMVVAAILLAPE